MNFLLTIIVHTANILGSFNDPFEFQGDYGPEINPTREKVFELVVAKEALSRSIENPLDKEKDRQHGPTLSELIPDELVNELIAKQQELNNEKFSLDDLERILNFIDNYANQKVFYFFRNHPPELLSLDKILRDQASREGLTFDLPILSSTQALEGQSSQELKINLLHKLFSIKTLDLTKPSSVLQKSIEEMNPKDLEPLFEKGTSPKDLEVFYSPAGQLFFYWLYQSLNLHLISKDPANIEQINTVKAIFASTLGNPQARADAFKEKLITTNSSIVFTQECDRFVPQALSENSFFHSVDKQNPQDGTYVFLRNDEWEPDYEVIPLNEYEGFAKGRLNVILATYKANQAKFLLASAHGNSTKPEDGRLQISLIMQKFQHLLSLYPGLQVIIGIDANTKSDEDVAALRNHLDDLGLIATSVGPTTIKQRMVTAQHSKAGRFAVDEEDYLITLKPENGGAFLLTDATVGFNQEHLETTQTLPNIHNPFDHYPVGATFKETGSQSQ